MFSQATIESIKSYVYALADSEDTIFYVGKGQGNRVFNHVEDVRRLLAADPTVPLESIEDDDSETEGMSLKQQRIAEMLRAGSEPAMYIIREGLTDEQAFLIEAVLISVLDWQLEGGLTGQIAGHGAARFGLKTVQEVEATKGEPFRLSDLPDLVTGEEVIAININRRWPEVVAGKSTLLAVSKGVWRLSQQRAAHCRYAIIHANNIVRGVFKIDRWEDVEGGRSAFVSVDPIPMSGSQFSQKNASSLFGAAGSGTQNPIRYVRLPQ